VADHVEEVGCLKTVTAGPVTEGGDVIVAVVVVDGDVVEGDGRLEETGERA
jgi:hypothetical protein